MGLHGEFSEVFILQELGSLGGTRKTLWRGSGCDGGAQNIRPVRTEPMKKNRGRRNVCRGCLV